MIPVLTTIITISIFLFVGLVTILSAPVAYWRLDNSASTARFLTPTERAQAVERLRANQTGAATQGFKRAHLIEAFLEPKTYLWVGMALLNNLGAQVTNTFGPLILKGLGFNPSLTSLLNMPFGALQFLVILASSWAAVRARYKSAILITLMLPVIAGLAMLYVLPRGSAHTGPLLVGYYLLAFLFGGNPLIASWIIANTAGGTKKAVCMSFYNAGASAGNIIGPLLFTANQAPAYLPGLRKVLGVYIALVGVFGIQVGMLMWLNRSQERSRVANGKPAKLRDHSMESRYEDMGAGNELNDQEGMLGKQAFRDLTDRRNDEFVYVY